VTSNIRQARVRGDALRRVVALLSSDALTFLDLLRGMEGCLVTTDDAKRARGVLLLAEAVAGRSALLNAARHILALSRGLGREPGASFYTRKRLSDGGQGERLMPPCTRGSISASCDVAIMFT